MVASNLPQANVRNPGFFDPNEFVEIPRVPVFAEHITTRKDGKVLQYGPAELQAIVNRCNRRIDETGDYATITIGHTPTMQQRAMGMQSPEVVGYAGPFYLGLVGTGETRKYAILADYHIMKGDIDKVRKNPRRSPEVWAEDRYEDQFLDPIALLGADAPRLDMGLVYSRELSPALNLATGCEVMRYAAEIEPEMYDAAGAPASPSGTNTFIPGNDDQKRKYDAQPRGARMLQPDEVKQIVDAIQQLDVFKFAQSLMQSQSPAGAGAAPPVPGAPPAGAVPGAAPAAPGAPHVPPMPGAPAPHPAAAGGAPPPVNAPSHKPPEHDSAAGAAGGALSGAASGAQMGSMIPGVGTAAGAVVGGLAGAAGGAAEPDRNAAGCAPNMPNHPPTGHSGGGNPYSAEADPNAPEIIRGGEIAPAQYAALQARLAQYEARAAQQDQIIDEERGKRIDAERYSALSAMRERFIFDVNREYERVRYAKMPAPEGFETHKQVLMDNCLSVPAGIGLYIDPDGAKPSAIRSVDGQPQRYSKEISDEALEICKAARMRGEEPDYAVTLAEVAAKKKTG